MLTTYETLDDHFKKLLLILDVICRWCYDVDSSAQMNIPVPVKKILDDRIIQRLAL